MMIGLILAIAAAAQPSPMTKTFSGKCDYKDALSASRAETRVPCNGIGISSVPGGRVMITFLNTGGGPMFSFAGRADLAKSNGRFSVDSIQTKPGIRQRTDTGTCAISTTGNRIAQIVCAAHANGRTYVGNFIPAQ